MNNNRLKYLYLIRILYEYTDDNNGLTANDIINKLAEVNVSVERKTFYKDITFSNSFLNAQLYLTI